MGIFIFPFFFVKIIGIQNWEGSFNMKKPKVAWGITGAGDKILETLKFMLEIQKDYGDIVDIEVLSQNLEIKW